MKARLHEQNHLQRETDTMARQHACHESQGQLEGQAIAMEGRTFLESSYENRKKEDVLLQEVEAPEQKMWPSSFFWGKNLILI